MNETTSSAATLATVPRGRRAGALLLSALLAGTLGHAVLARSVPDISLAERALEALSGTGVSHPVTAVLLQYRSFDTLLEIAVLLAAALVALALQGDAVRTSQPIESPVARAIDTPLLAALTRALHPVLVLVAVYLLWAGATRPGGAFQAGAVLAALGVLRRVSGVAPGDAWLARWRTPLLLGGLATFLLLATLMLVPGGALLAWPTAWAGALILAIEAVLTVSIAVSLVGLFASAPDR